MISRRSRGAGGMVVKISLTAGGAGVSPEIFMLCRDFLKALSGGSPFRSERLASEFTDRHCFPGEYS